MKLTAFTDYSLRVLIYLATTPHKRSTILEIVTAFGVSEHHLTKVVHFLGKKGWITTTRGKGGGISLAKDPKDIRIGRVVRDTEGEPTPAECFESGGGQCAIGGCCSLKGVLGEAITAFYDALDRYTLADVTHNSAELGQVLNFYRSAPVQSAA
jgi:Rrf2 family transcriptional regulator, nitric oxide-sensitive transcriptional repressor